MFKRILFSALALLSLYSSIIVGYYAFQPEYETFVDESYIGKSIDYETLESFALAGGSSTYHYYFFCNPESNDCVYLANSVLKDAERQTKVDLSELLEYVEVPYDLDPFTIKDMKEKWHISSYPAFVAIYVSNDSYDVQNTLESPTNTPLSTSDILQWLSLNDLYDVEAQ